MSEVKNRSKKKLILAILHGNFCSFFHFINKKIQNFILFILRAVKFASKLMSNALAKRIRCTILYATETGKSEVFSKTLAEIFKHAFDARVHILTY